MQNSLPYKVTETQSHRPTLQVYDGKWRYLHSAYDPVREARELAQSWGFPDKGPTIYGLGLGYHVIEYLKMHPDEGFVDVIETRPEVVEIAQKVHPALFQDSRFHLHEAYTEEDLVRALTCADVDGIRIHPPSVEICPFPRQKVLLQDMQLLHQAARQGATLLDENWTANHGKLKSGPVFTGERNRFMGNPGILISAGPSLDESLSPLYALQDLHPITLSVSAVLRRLLMNGIIPTAAVMSDGGPIIRDHVASLPVLERYPRLLMLATGHPEIPSLYPGDVHWVFQNSFPPANDFAMANGFDTFRTGGSVALLGLSILHYWGCDPIVFVGQDLAFTHNKPYAGDTNHDFMVPTTEGYRTISTVSVTGEAILTTLTWNSFRKRIENFIWDNADRTYINTSMGAHIFGTTFVPIGEFVEKLRRKE